MAEKIQSPSLWLWDLSLCVVSIMYVPRVWEFVTSKQESPEVELIVVWVSVFCLWFLRAERDRIGRTQIDAGHMT